jgi:hypothetical protein
MVHIAVAGRKLIVGSLCIFFLGLVVLAQSADQIASETGLDRDLVGVLRVDVGGTELAIIVVYVNERAFQSGISKNPTLYHRLFPYVGKNALYINPTVEHVVSSFAFSPSHFSIEQVGAPTFLPTAFDWVEITSGFLEGRFEVNPGGESYGSGSEGILIMGDRIDPTQPFTVVYQGQRARFEIAQQLIVSRPTAVTPTPAPSAIPSRETVEVPALEDVTTLEEILSHGDFTAETMAALLDLDPNLVGTIQVEPKGEELRMLVIRLDEEVRDSALGLELLSRLESVIGTGAVMIWAFSPTGADFSPWHFFIQQAATNYVFFSGSSFVELTTDFLDTARVEAGTVAAGVILLPKAIDPHGAYSVFYGSASVAFPARNWP